MPSSLPHPRLRTPITASALADLSLPEVVERLSHRRGVQGRATVVLCVREVTSRQAVPLAQGAKDTETPDSRGYVSKLMWRESGQRPGREVLEKLVGIYGLAQHLWHSDAPKAKRCLDTTPNRDQVLACKDLTNLDIVPDEEDGKEVEHNSAWTGDYSTMHTSYLKRVYCWLPMPTVGEPLWAADSPRNLLEAVLGAILGYWGLFNEGMLCRDMSDGNVLMLQGGRGFDYREWKGRQPANATSTRLATIKSRGLLQEYLKRLGRNPRGFLLNDLRLYSACPQVQVELVENRTVTPRFMSSRLCNIIVDQPYTHHFMDDLESFFWLIIWTTAAHLDPQVRKRTPAARSIVSGLDQPNLSNIYAWKRSLLIDCGRFGGREIKKRLASWGNAWASDPMVVSVIVDLGSFFYGIDHYDLDNPNYNPDLVFPCVVEIIVRALGMQPA